MAATVEYRREEMSSGETKEKEKGDDLSLFVDCSGVNLNLDLLQKSNQYHVTFDSEFENQLKPEIVPIIHGQDAGSDDLLISLKKVTDYEWLLSPPRHPVNSPQMDEHMILTNPILISNRESISPESKIENPSVDGTSTTYVSSKLPASSINGVKSSTAIRRPSPSRKGSTSATPTTRTKPIRSSTPTSRATETAPTKPVVRSKTPTTRPPVLAAATKSTSRSSTPSKRPAILPVASKSTSSSRSSTPVQRPSITVSAKSAWSSRSSTPVQRPSITASAKSASSSRSSPVQRPSITASAKSASSSRSSTPTQRSSNTSVYTNRSSSAMKSRGKSRPLVNQPDMNMKAVPKRVSNSPSKRHVGVKSGITKGGKHVNDDDDDDVNPVLMGTKMVERVVNMRKLGPPKEDHIRNQNNSSKKLSVSQNNSGFGRSLSNKSFDMALRHLDIRRSMPGNMRATITKVPASSVYSVRPESTKTRTTESPLATSSSGSSDHSETAYFYHQPAGGSGGGIGVGFPCEA